MELMEITKEEDVVGNYQSNKGSVIILIIGVGDLLRSGREHLNYEA